MSHLAITVAQSLESQTEHDQKDFFLEIEAYEIGFARPADPVPVEFLSYRESWRLGVADALVYGRGKN